MSGEPVKCRRMALQNASVRTKITAAIIRSRFVGLMDCCIEATVSYTGSLASGKSMLESITLVKDAPRVSPIQVTIHFTLMFIYVRLFTDVSLVINLL